MVYFLYALFFVSCIVLIASVLLQPGKTDAGALFTSNVSSTAFQPRGSQTILSKITIAAATAFMLSALFLAMPALTGNISVLQTTSENQTETAPVDDANTNANVEANANVSLGNSAVQTINANVSANSNISIVMPDNNVANTNVAGKQVEPKPAQQDKSNK